MRKHDEIALYAWLRELRGQEPFNKDASDLSPVWPNVAQRIDMCERRCYYLLEKWSGIGWWDYGVNARFGWFTPEAPQELEP